MFAVSFAKGEVAVSSAICFEPLRKVIKRDHSISVAGFAATGYAVLRSNAEELISSYLAAHPDPQKLKMDLHVYTQFLLESRRHFHSRGRSVEPSENQRKFHNRSLLRHVPSLKEPRPEYHRSGSQTSLSSIRTAPVTRARALSGESSGPDRYQ